MPLRSAVAECPSTVIVRLVPDTRVDTFCAPVGKEVFGITILPVPLLSVRPRVLPLRENAPPVIAVV